MLSDKNCGKISDKYKNITAPVFKFGDKLIKCDVVFNRDVTLKSPTIEEFEFKPTELYTIMMVDPDAPVSKKQKKFWLHWLKINTNETKSDYTPPTPPPGSGPHRYFICLFQQEHKLTDIASYEDMKLRSSFDPHEFVKENGLTLIAFTKFIVKG